MTIMDLAIRFAAAAGLGVLLGLERQQAQGGDTAFAGVRTFALITLLGAAAGYLYDQFGQLWPGAIAFVAVAALTVASYVFTARRGEIGITTEVMALLAFVIGSLCAVGQVGLAAALTVASTLLLALKDWLHRLADRIDPADVAATLKFAIITVIILPLLPNQNYGPPPLDVVNPYKLWLMVVLISGLNFLSYVLVKGLGGEHGLGLTGILGGLVSSTAVTLGFSQRSRREPALARALALGIVLAWTVMFIRVLVAVAVVNPVLGLRLAPGIGVLGLASLGLSLFLWRRRSNPEAASVASGTNPFELGAAIKFGLLFGVILVVSRAAEVYFGAVGLYVAGAVAGLTDVDAISLSMANLAARDPGSLGAAGRTVLIAVLSNTVVKGGMASSLGAAELRRVLLPATGMLLAAGIAAAVLVG